MSIHRRPIETRLTGLTSSSPCPPRINLKPSFLITASFLVLLAFYPFFNTLHIVTSQTCLQTPESSQHLPHPGWAHTNISSASQGKLWRPAVFRKFHLPRRITPSPTEPLPPPPVSPCTTYAVVTTIFDPTHLLHQLRNLSHVCLIIVGDHKTNHLFFRQFASHALANRTVYLSEQDQQNLPFRSVKYIPWNHFGRKNIGYLYAISRGANYIWDTDDDNILRSESHFFRLDNLAKSNTKLPLADIALTSNTTTNLWNPYPFFKPLNPRSANPVPEAWPRGLPLQFVRDTSTSDPHLSGASISVQHIAVFQSLANNDPDVDAIFRLTRQLPLFFHQENLTIALPQGRICPLNAQASFWTRQAFWGLLLPVTVHGRVSDIWRSYIAQRLMADVGLHAAFTSPVVEQLRNAHSLLADLQAEVPLYTQAHELVRWLQRWKPNPEVADSLFMRMEQLFVDLYEIGVIEEQDVLLTQAWLDDLEAMGYGAKHEDKSVAERLKAKVDVSLPETVEPVVDTQPNVAVCVSGQIRTLTLEPEDEDHPKGWVGMASPLPPQNMTVAESIQRILYPRLGKPDVFMVVSTRETEHEPKVGDTSVCEPLRPRNGGHLSCQVEKERNVTVGRWEMWEEFYFVKREHRKELAQGLLQQLKGMWQCHAAIQNHTKVTGKKYDWIVRMRPDNYMIEFPLLDRLALDSKVPTIWYGSFKKCCCGNEDRFGISRADWMREYFERFMYLQTWDWNWSEHGKSGWNAEAFLKEVVKAFGVQLVPHDDIHLCTVKPLHRKRRSDP